MRYRPTDLLETGAYVLVADEYEWCDGREGVFLAPSNDCRYPQNFTEVNIYDVYLENPSHSPHVELLQMDLNEKSQVKNFVEKWGLLGVGKKWEWIRNWYSADHLNEVEVVKTIGFSRFEDWRTEASPEEGFRIPGEDYFESILAPSLDLESMAGSTPCDRGRFFESYGEWVETPKFHFSGTLDEDNPAIPKSYKELSYKPPTFTEAARDLQEKAQYILRKRNKQDRSYPGTFSHDFRSYDEKEIGDLKATWEERTAGELVQELHAASLLDFCYFLMYQDIRKKAIARCKECFKTIYNAPSGRGRKSLFCDSGCRQRFNDRKTHHRQASLKPFLKQKHALKNWPKNKNGNPEHPYEMIDEMTKKQRDLAEEWAKQVRARQQKGSAPANDEYKSPKNSGKRWKEDPLLEPFLD